MSATASSAIVSDENQNLISRNIYDQTSIGHLNWTSATTDIHLITKNTLAYWNGRYNSSSSNLAYCNKGAFGTMAIKTVGNGFSDSSNTLSVAYGTAANTAIQGNATLLNLNGTNQTAASIATFYAPITVGTENNVLVSSGSGAPSWSALVDLIFPVGAIYLARNANTDPNVIFPGTTWEQIGERFLWCANGSGTAYDTFGGASSYELVANAGAYNSSIESYMYWQNSASNFQNRFKTGSTNASTPPSFKTDGFSRNTGTISTANHSTIVTVKGASTTGTATTDRKTTIMPPWRAIAAWIRTA